MVGDYLNEGEKEEFLKTMRTNAFSIEPDILGNCKMKVSFVPVKCRDYPFNFITGRFVIRISIEPGLRDDLYTYKNEEG